MQGQILSHLFKLCVCMRAHVSTFGRFSNGRVSVEVMAGFDMSRALTLCCLLYFF